MIQPSRLRPRDAVRVAGAGLRTRPLRVVLSALGIAVGIAAMVAVIGISASSRAEIDLQLQALGTDLLTVEPGQTLIGGETAKLPEQSVDMVARIDAVTSVSAVGAVEDAYVYRNDRIDKDRTNGITTMAARLDLLDAVGGELSSGRWLDDALADHPTVVLGATTAERLGVSQTDASTAVCSASSGSSSSASSSRHRWHQSSTPQRSSAGPSPRTSSAATARPPCCTNAPQSRRSTTSVPSCRQRSTRRTRRRSP
jgi:putative ABC transport system permease protein